MGTSPKKPWASLIRPVVKKPAASAPPSASAGSPPETLSPYHRDDPIPRAEAIEKDTDTTWATWTDLASAENRKFADTQPATRSMRASSDERSYAATEPAPLQKLQALPVTPVRRQLTVVEVMVEARRNNRVCPQPARWQQLFDMLPGKTRSDAGWEPVQPLLGAAWKDTPSIPKRMVFREHIEWAASHGFLQEVFMFMKDLPESDWHHMGD